MIKLLNKYLVKFGFKIVRLEAKKKAKLNEINVVEIRRLRESGESYARLAQRYGVTLSTIRDIVKYHTWKSV